MEITVAIMLGVGLIAILGVIIWLSFLTQNKDKGAEIRAQLGIITGITAAVIGIFGGAAYMYFSANVNYMTPFLLWMSFFNMFASLLAVSISTIQITSN